MIKIETARRIEKDLEMIQSFPPMDPGVFEGGDANQSVSHADLLRILEYGLNLM